MTVTLPHPIYLVLPSINLITMNGVNSINAANVHPIHCDPEPTDSFTWSFIWGSPIIIIINNIQVDSNTSAIICFMCFYLYREYTSGAMPRPIYYATTFLRLSTYWAL